MSPFFSRRTLVIPLILATSFLASCTNTNTSISADDGRISVTVTGTTASNNTSSHQSGDRITLNNESVTITNPGEYTLIGTIADGQVIVDAGADATVTITLDGVDISSKTSSAFYVRSGKVTLVLADGSTNTLSDATTYTDTSDDAPNAALYAEEDLVITGNGTLTVHGNANDGITSKDDLTIKSGNITVVSLDDAIRGKDSLTIENGTITITSGGDGLKTDDETKGNMVIQGGDITITADSDGAQAYTSLTINGGNITIKQSEEGLESEKIIINDGVINIKSSDDGINVSSSSSSEGSAMPAFGGSQTENNDIKITINGGTIMIDADADGLDANGSIELNGGNIVVYGPIDNGNGALDYDATFKITGGSFVAFGSAGMAMNASTISTQNTVLINLSNSVAASGSIVIRDGSGNTVYE